MSRKNPLMVPEGRLGDHKSYICTGWAISLWTKVVGRQTERQTADSQKWEMSPGGKCSCLSSAPLKVYLCIFITFCCLLFIWDRFSSNARTPKLMLLHEKHHRPEQGQVKHSWSNLFRSSPAHSACQPPNHLPFPVIPAVAPVVFLPVTWTTHNPHTCSLFNQLHAHTFHRTLPVRLLSCPCNRVQGCPPDFCLLRTIPTFLDFSPSFTSVIACLYHRIPPLTCCWHMSAL